MSNSGFRHASSSTHFLPRNDAQRRDPRAWDPQASWSRRLGEPSRPRRASTGTWALCSFDNRDASWAGVQVGGSAPRRSSPGSSREIPESHNPPPVTPGFHNDYDCEEYDDVLNSPTPSSPSAKSLSLAPSEDHVQLARAAALARSISKQRAAGRDPAQPLSPPDKRSLGSWWSFLPGAAADGSRVSVADGERRVDEPHRRRSGADVGPSTRQIQTFGPRAHPAARFPPPSPIDGLLTVTDGSQRRFGSDMRVGHGVGEQTGWRPPRPGPPGARAHGDSPGCARPPDPDKAPVRGSWNPNIVPVPCVAPRLPSLPARSGVRDRSRADEYVRAPPVQVKRAAAAVGRPRSPTANAETKFSGSYAAVAPRAPVQRASLATAPSDAGAGVLHSEEGLSTESERRALYDFDRLMLARGLVGIFKLRCIQQVEDGERYWQFKCTLLVMEPYPSETCVYRGARVTRATRIEARAAAAQDALSALSESPVASRRHASLSPLALVPDTPCPPYRRDPPSPEVVLPDVATLSRMPPSLIVTHDDEPDDLIETYSVGTHTPSHGSMSSCYELVYDDPDLLLLDQSQMPRSVSANAASRLEWPGDPPPDSSARDRPVSR